MLKESQSVVFCIRSTASELILECEEEELEPWQKQTSHVQLKDEDVGESSMSHQILEEYVGVEVFWGFFFYVL